MKTHIHPSQVKKLKKLGVTDISIEYYFEDKDQSPNGITFEMVMESYETRNIGFWLWVNNNENEPDFMITPCLKGGFVVNGGYNNFMLKPESGAVFGSLKECVHEVFNILQEKV